MGLKFYIKLKNINESLNMLLNDIAVVAYVGDCGF